MAEANQKSVKRRFKWIIDGVCVTREKLEKPDFRLYSDPVLIDLGDKKTEWKGFINSEIEGYLGVYLHKSKPPHVDLLVNYSIRLHDITGTSKQKFSDVHKSWGWKLISFKTLFDSPQKYLEDGSKIELIFDLEVFYEDNKEESPSPKNNYSKFFNDTELANFTLISSDGEPFQVHRTILALESDFFRTLFTIDMKEKQEGSVKFEEIDSVAMKEVLSYIYNGETDIKDVEKASNVIYGAEKFNLPGLKKICCDALDEKICNKNVIEILAIADLYRVKELEDSCLRIIMKNYEAVLQTEGWKSLTLPLCKKISFAFYLDSKIAFTVLNSTL